MHLVDVSIDPLTGLRTRIGFEDGKMVVKQDQDVTPNLEHALTLRNDTEYSKQGIKKNLWHCVHIPESVCLQMLTEDGFDVYSAHASEVRKFLSRNKAKYGKLFTTEGQF